jgi:hypothetical protein
MQAVGLGKDEIVVYCKSEPPHNPFPAGRSRAVQSAIRQPPPAQAGGLRSA